MLKWIEDAGGSRAIAVQVAPVLRALAKKDDVYPLVTFTTEASTHDCDEIVLESSSLEELHAALERLQEAMAKACCIRVEGVGSFTLRPSMSKDNGRLQGKICLVTGGAQGFGEGIARELAAFGARIVIADMNLPLAEQVAASLRERYGSDSALALSVNVGDEDSVSKLIEEIVCQWGGLDLLISNAGVLRAGGLEEMTLANFDFVTKINYTAFFLMTKYGSRPMKIMSAWDSAYSGDIIQINSKSGLEGSNKNFAYAGGKFGGIGLVQSFAKELVDHRIKVNAICPGNYYEGPLWSDPENGLFVQYLRAGKVPGAQTVSDVYNAYVAKVPMRRGCSPKDVSRAIAYCVEQEYETGQAIPVTGGQNMLH